MISVHQHAAMPPTLKVHEAVFHLGEPPKPKQDRRVSRRSVAATRVVVRIAPKPREPTAPVTVYDSTMPSAIPASAKYVAAYRNGGYAESASEFPGKRIVWWVDTQGTDPHDTNALDVEPGDASPSQIPRWVDQELQDHSQAWLYEGRSSLAEVRAEVQTLPQREQERIRYWDADYSARAHVSPGAEATQWFGGGINGPQQYDVSEIAGHDR
jgi:hypothetical protein